VHNRGNYPFIRKGLDFVLELAWALDWEGGYDFSSIPSVDAVHQESLLAFEV
jgi:hypothetical protein